MARWSILDAIRSCVDTYAGGVCCTIRTCSFLSVTMLSSILSLDATHHKFFARFYMSFRIHALCCWPMRRFLPWLVFYLMTHVLWTQTSSHGQCDSIHSTWVWSNPFNLKGFTTPSKVSAGDYMDAHTVQTAVTCVFDVGRACPLGIPMSSQLSICNYRQRNQGGIRGTCPPLFSPGGTGGTLCQPLDSFPSLSLYAVELVVRAERNFALFNTYLAEEGLKPPLQVNNKLTMLNYLLV